MKLRAAIPLALLAGGLTHPAHAQQPGSPAPLWGFLSVATPDETPADVTAFAHVGLSVGRAIEIAEAHNQGRVVEIGFSRKGGYAVTLATPAGLHFVQVAAATGDLSAAGRPDVGRDRLDAQGQRDLDALAATHVTLEQAVRLAEHLTGGRSIAAGMEQLAGIPQFYVQTFTGQALAPVIVDPRTGRAARPQ